MTSANQFNHTAVLLAAINTGVFNNLRVVFAVSLIYIYTHYQNNIYGSKQSQKIF
jgi:hypothetical protein